MITSEDINEIVHRINDQIHADINGYICGDHPFAKDFYQLDWHLCFYYSNVIVFKFLYQDIFEFDTKHDKNMPKTELEDNLKMKILEIKNVFSKIKLKLE